MAKKILVAIDDSENGKRTADFIAESFSRDNRITLFSVVPDTAALCDMNSPELTPHFLSQQSSFCTLEDQKKNLVSQAQETAKARLVEAGFDEKRIALKTQLRKKGIARDIVAESQDGYDLLVIGRRGVTGIKEYFLGSISQKVLHLSKDVSVLIVN